MLDRIPSEGKEGRVLITPENGSAPFYATMTMADEPIQDGTPLNKNTLLKDSTAALFGLGADAVPDDIFHKLSGIGNLHVWSRYGKEVPSATQTQLTNVSFSAGDTLYCSYTFTNDGSQFSLGETLTVWLGDYNTDTDNLVNLVAGKYVILEETTGTTMYYVPPNVVITANGDSDNPDLLFSSVTRYSSPHFAPADLEYVVSDNANAYPPSEDDGYTYEYLGQLGSGMTKIATGSYVGNGKFGSATPNSLTFDFVPKIIWIYGKRGSVSSANKYFESPLTGHGAYNIANTDLWTTEYTQYTGFTCSGDSIFEMYGKKSADGKTYTWYHGYGNSYQLNATNNVYYYIAIA